MNTCCVPAIDPEYVYLVLAWKGDEESPDLFGVFKSLLSARFTCSGLKIFQSNRLNITTVGYAQVPFDQVFDLDEVQHPTWYLRQDEGELPQWVPAEWND